MPAHALPRPPPPNCVHACPRLTACMPATCVPLCGGVRRCALRACVLACWRASAARAFLCSDWNAAAPPLLCCDAAVCDPQIASRPGGSERLVQEEFSDTSRILNWVQASNGHEQGDPNSPPTPRTAASSSLGASSLHGEDSEEFNMRETIKRLQQERDRAEQRALAAEKAAREERERALAAEKAAREEVEMLRSQNRELAVTVTAEGSARATKISEQRRRTVRAQAAKLKRMLKIKTEEPKRGRFTRVRPDQMACSAVERNAGASLVMSTTTLAAGPDPKRGRGQPRKWRSYKKAIDEVKVIMPGRL